MPYYLQDDLARGAVGVGVLPNAMKTSNAQPNGSRRLYGASQGDTGEWIDPADVGATTFTGLTDTPDSYVNQATKILAVNAAGTALGFGDAPFAFVGSTPPADLAPYTGQLVLVDHVIYAVVPHPHSAHNAQMSFRDPVSSDIAVGVQYRGSFANYLSIGFAPAEDNVIYTRDDGRLYKYVNGYWRWLEVPRYITYPPANDEDHARIAVVASALAPKNGLLVSWSGSDLRAVQNYVAPTSATITYDLVKLTFTAEEIKSLVAVHGYQVRYGTGIPGNDVGQDGEVYFRNVEVNGVVTRVDFYVKLVGTWDLVFSFPVGSTSSGITATAAQGIAQQVLETAIDGGESHGATLTYQNDNTIDIRVTNPLPDNETPDQIGYGLELSRNAQNELVSRWIEDRVSIPLDGALPTATDDIYDAMDGHALKVAFANGQWYRGGRKEAADHRAMGTFSHVDDGTNLTPGSGPYNWRGVHEYDANVNNPQSGDVFIKTHSGIDRWRYYDGSSWSDLTHSILVAIRYRGIYATENDARAHVVGENDLVAYRGEGNSYYSLWRMGADFVPAPQYDPHWYPMIQQELVSTQGTFARDIAARIPVDSAMTVARFGGSNYLEGFATDLVSAHGSTDPEVPDGSRLRIDWVARARDISQTPSAWRNKAVIRIVKDDSHPRQLSNKRFRWSFSEYTLVYVSDTTSNSVTYETYRTTQDVANDPDVGDIVHWNLEDPEVTTFTSGPLSGPPWLWHYAAEGTDGVDSTVARKEAELTGSNILRITDTMTDIDPVTNMPREVEVTVDLSTIAGVATINATSPLDYNAATGVLSIAGIDGDLLLGNSVPPSKLQNFNAEDVPVLSAGFDGQLAPTDNTVQKALQKFDDLVISGTGTDGDDGRGTVAIFRRSSTAPGTPTGGAWNGTTFVAPTGWGIDVPGGTDQLYVVFVTLLPSSGTVYHTPIAIGGGGSGGSDEYIDSIGLRSNRYLDFAYADNLPDVEIDLHEAAIYPDSYTLDSASNELTIEYNRRISDETVDFTPIVTPTNQRVPSGGDSGQVLAKSADDDYMTEWVDQSGGSMDAGNFLGEIWAETGTLATAGLQTNDYLSTAQAAWTTTANAPTGVVVEDDVYPTSSSSSSSFTSSGVAIPVLAPDGVMGIVAELLVDGTVISNAFMPWGPGASAFVASPTDERRGRTSSVLAASQNQHVTLVWFPDEAVADADVDIRSHIVLGYAQGSLPADTTVRIRAARPVGPASSMDLTNDSVEPQHVKASNTPTASLRNLRRVDDENFEWVADPTGSGNFGSIAAGSKGTIDVTDDGSGNYTIDVGTDEITATELAANAIQPAHVSFASGTQETDGYAVTLDGSNFSTSVLRNMPDPSGGTDGQVPKIASGAWTIGDDNTGATPSTDFTEGVTVTTDATDNEVAVDITQSGAQHAIEIDQQGNATAFMLRQNTNRTALQVETPNNTNEPAFKLITAASGDRKGFQITNQGQNLAWASFEFQAGGSNRPGLALGPGNGARDVNLYRATGNTLRTDDAFQVGLSLDVGGTATLGGAVTLNTAPTAANHAVRKSYADALVPTDNLRRRVLTQAEYNALATKDANVAYLISDA